MVKEAGLELFLNEDAILQALNAERVAEVQAAQAQIPETVPAEAASGEAA